MKTVKTIITAILCTIMVMALGVPALASNAPSSWAAEQVNAAIAQGLVPANLQANYTQAITRAEFCALAVALYETVKGEIAGRVNFTDTSDINVQKAASVGIVNGVGNNRFDPHATLTREMAAVMLANLAKAIGKPFPNLTARFADIGTAASWALDGIGGVQAAGIMSGTGDNRFSPKQPYTREQSIVTILRVLEYILASGSTPGTGDGLRNWNVVVGSKRDGFVLTAAETQRPPGTPYQPVYVSPMLREAMESAGPGSLFKTVVNVSGFWDYLYAFELDGVNYWEFYMYVTSGAWWDGDTNRREASAGMWAQLEAMEEAAFALFRAKAINGIRALIGDFEITDDEYFKRGHIFVAHLSAEQIEALEEAKAFLKLWSPDWAEPVLTNDSAVLVNW